MRDLRVVEVQIHGMTGYQVQGSYRDCSDSLWETVAHAAVFQDRARAERFLQKCSNRPSWTYNWHHWGKPADYIHSQVDAVQGLVSVYSVL
jgi:hypothetical protein